MRKEIDAKDILKYDHINIIDIRSVEKYNDSHIKGAINIPKILLINNPKKYLDKYKIYYIYCQKGIQSIKVCDFLNKLGYHAINIKGGYESWLMNN